MLIETFVVYDDVYDDRGTSETNNVKSEESCDDISV